jgi:hypothetical protein
MTPVDRPAVGIDIGAVTMQLDQLLGDVVVCSAEALQRTEPKGSLVLLMRHNVVGNRSRNNDALLQAHGAKRMFAQLMARTLAPTLPAIPRHAFAQCCTSNKNVGPPASEP